MIGACVNIHAEMCDLKSFLFHARTEECVLCSSINDNKVVATSELMKYTPMSRWLHPSLLQSTHFWRKTTYDSDVTLLPRQSQHNILHHFIFFKPPKFPRFFFYQSLVSQILLQVPVTQYSYSNNEQTRKKNSK